MRVFGILANGKQKNNINSTLSSLAKGGFSCFPTNICLLLNNVVFCNFSVFLCHGYFIWYLTPSFFCGCLGFLKSSAIVSFLNTCLYFVNIFKNDCFWHFSNSIVWNHFFAVCFRFISHFPFNIVFSSESENKNYLNKCIAEVQLVQLFRLSTTCSWEQDV